jgi:phosphoesterase RecJ-like protein
MTNELGVVLDAIQQSRRVVVVSHTNPDADAYGSSCGLADGIRVLGKEVVVHNESGFVPRYSVIPGASQVVKGEWSTLSEGDLLIVCDCGALERVGDSMIAAVKAAPLVINIDHHNANSRFGHINYVIEGASSTSELVYDILIALEQRTHRTDILTTTSGSCLLAGIIGDTGSFKYASTHASTFLAAYEIVKRGVRPDRLTQELFANHSLAAVKLQAAAISQLQVRNEGRFAEVVVTQEMLKAHGAELLDADSLAERARDIEGVRVSALYKQDVDMWRVSLRARQGAVDVSAVAQQFGGGGHKPAAAFRWKRDFETLQRELREAITKALEQGAEAQ